MFLRIMGSQPLPIHFVQRRAFSFRFWIRIPIFVFWKYWDHNHYLFIVFTERPFLFAFGFKNSNTYVFGEYWYHNHCLFIVFRERPFLFAFEFKNSNIYVFWEYWYHNHYLFIAVFIERPFLSSLENNSKICIFSMRKKKFHKK